MPQMPAPLNKGKSRFLQKMDVAQAIQDPVERAWGILDVHYELYNCAQGAICYIQDSDNPEVVSLLTDTPAQVDNRLYGLQFNLKYSAYFAEVKFNEIVAEHRNKDDYRPDQKYDDALCAYVEAEREYTRVTKSIRHAINGSHRAMNCHYDENLSIMENFLAAGKWLKKEKQKTLREYGPRPERELAF